MLGFTKGYFLFDNKLALALEDFDFVKKYSVKFAYINQVEAIIHVDYKAGILFGGIGYNFAYFNYLFNCFKLLRFLHQS